MASLSQLKRLKAQSGLTDEQLREQVTYVKWDTPIVVNGGLACRYCIARIGLIGSETAQLPRTMLEFEQHLAEHHGRKVDAEDEPGT